MEFTPSPSFHHGLRQLRDEAKARTVVVIKTDGNLIDASGEIQGLDLASISALASGVLVAAYSIGNSVGAGYCKGVSLEGESSHFYITKLGNDEILIIIFGSQTNEGIVRLRVKQHRNELERLLGKSSQIEEIKNKEPLFEDLILTPKPRPKVKNIFDALSESEIDDALRIG